MSQMELWIFSFVANWEIFFVSGQLGTAALTGLSLQIWLAFADKVQV